jgi:carbonic anhydrase
MADFGKLISGYRLFKATGFQERKEIIGHLDRQGVQPGTLFITCADLRVAPDIMFSTNPGELFVFRNLGGFIPPFNEKGTGMLAAIEYAVCNLKVENIVVMGHAKCGIIKLLMEDKNVAEEASGAEESSDDSIKAWLSVAKEAKDSVKKALAKKTQEEQESACEHEAILLSMRNLISYPFIDSLIHDGQLKIYGWHFNMDEGVLYGFDPQTKHFEPLG